MKIVQALFIFAIVCVCLLEKCSGRPSYTSHEAKSREERSAEESSSENNDMRLDNFQDSHFGVLYVPFYKIRRYYIEKKHVEPIT